MKNGKIRTRTYILALLVIFLPVLANLYSPLLMVEGIKIGIITLSALVFGVWLILSLFLGRSISCGYTCPYGALQEILGRYTNKKPKSKKASQIRYPFFVLFLIIVSYSILKIGGLKGVNLFASNGNPKLVILIPLFILLIGILSLIFGNRAFCKYLCPQGVFLTIGTKLGRKIKIPSLHLKNNHNCSNCELCNKSCPMGLDVNYMVKNDKMENLNCILCGECIENCPKNVINYSFSIKD
jgi:polyferredoxin